MEILHQETTRFLPNLTNIAMESSSLLAISPLDGRYASKVDSLRPIFSEYGLIRARIHVESEWLKALAASPEIPELPQLSEATIALLQKISQAPSIIEVTRVKTIESTTNHDVKAVEYFIKEQLKNIRCPDTTLEFIHFACTSEDINNLSYGLLLQEARDTVMLPKLNNLITQLQQMAQKYAALPMLSRTHGQIASPTTVGKELANTIARLERQHHILNTVPILGKMNGAVGNYNAHIAAYPDVDWPKFSQKFVTSLGLHWQPYTTQIEPHDGIAELCDAFKRINTICIDLCRDLWGYISLGYFKQTLKAGEIGSSTMPHKINPIDFENAEGNLGIANALFNHFAEKLPISRWQRDLSDSTVLRALGSAFGHTLISFDALLHGLNKLSADKKQLSYALDTAWEVLAEAIQTVMRRHGLNNPYERLKQLTRGQHITEQTIRKFIASLDIPNDAKQRLLAMTPSNYTGLAQQLTEEVQTDIDQH